MFLLPSIALGLIFAALLGGRLERLLEVHFAAAWSVFLALAIQIVLFTAISPVPPAVAAALHIGSYGLLLVFAIANRRFVALAPVMLGMLLNGVVIAVNGGSMPVTRTAARAAGLMPSDYESVSEHARSLRFLGDVFAIPSSLPLSNTFSVGDLLISFGMIAFIVVVSQESGRQRSLSIAQTLRPLRLPSYRSLLAGKLISSVGDWLTLAALVGWRYESTGSTGAVALILLARVSPPIVGGGIAAFVVDRLRKDRVLVYVELGRGLAVLVALLGVLANLTTAVLIALAFSGLLAAISGAATSALLPSLTTADELAGANAGLGLVTNGAMALGAGAAGVAVASTQVPLALGLDIATFAVGAALFARVRPTLVPEQIRPERERQSGLRYLCRKPRILLLVLSFSIATFATGLTNATLPRLLGGIPHLDGGSYGFGIATLAAGLAVGEIAVGFSRIGSTAGRWIGSGLLLAATLLGLLALSNHAPTAFVVLALIGFVDGSTDILYNLVIQRGVDPRYYGAVFGVSSASMAATMVGAFALAPLLGDLMSARAVVVVGAASFAAGGVVALLAMTSRGRDAVAERAEPALAAS